jgi:hypothetical protein
MSDVVQLSVLVANEAGRVSEVTKALGEAGIDIRGFSVSDTADYGILRLVVDQPQKAQDVLEAAGYTVKAASVLCVDLPDVPGGLASVLRTVSDAGVTIQYVYSLIGTFVVLNVADVAKATAMLDGRPVRLVSQEEISAL